VRAGPAGAGRADEGPARGRDTATADDMNGPEPSRWARRLVRLCLRTWPRRVRERDGPSLVQALEETLEADRASLPGRRGAGSADRLRRASLVISECRSVVAAGIAMRGTAAARALRALAFECVGDARRSARSLVRSPGFTVTASLTIGLGLGATAAVFGVVDRMLLTPPPYREPHELAFVWSMLGSSPGRHRVAAPDVAALRARATAFVDVAFVGRPVDGAIETADGAAAQHVLQAPVTPNLFDVLGVAAGLGRTFAPLEGPASSGDPAGPLPVLLSDGLWQRAFASDPGVVGRTARLDGRAVEILGVLRSDFHLVMPPSAGIATDVDVWLPLRTPLADLERADGRRVDQDTDNTGAAIARLRTGATLRQASVDVERIAAELRSEVPGYATSDHGFEARALHEDAAAHIRPLLTAVLVAVGVVLLVTCLNVSTLLLARGVRRRAELAVRVALGAGRLRIVRQSVAESLTLVLLGTALAVPAAAGLQHVLALSRPAGFAGPGELGLDARLLVFTAAVAAVAAVVCGLAPAYGMARAERRGRLGRHVLRGRDDGGRAREALVVMQVALSVTVVLSSGLLLRTFQELVAVRPGFVPEGAMTFNVAVRTPDRYVGPAERARLMADITSALEELPRVRAAGLTGHLPLGGRSWTQPFGLPGQAESEWARNRADFRTVSSGYFAAMGTRLLDGRAFIPREDLEEDRRVVIIDARLAERIAPGGSALGAVLGFPLDGSPVQAEVVGVVEHVRHESLRADGREALYVPYRQEASRDVSFVVRTEGEPAALAPAIRQAVLGIDEQLPVYGLRTMTDYVGAAVGPTRFALTVVSGFAALVLLSVGVGLYGVVALEVGRRTRDIGLRMAVGADRGKVLASVMWMGLRLVAWGASIGTILALGTAKGLDAVLYGAGMLDPGAWAVALAAVSAVALAACWVPARRASRLDPTVALRHD